jgi:NADH-quinone oxidoreductase subunit J
LVESIYLIISSSKPNAIVAPDASFNTMDTLREMAQTLFNDYLLPFEVTSILLLVAMVGVIVLNRHEKAGRS